MKSLFKFTGRLILVLLVLLALTLGWLSVIGFPTPLRRFVENQLEYAGWPSRFGTIKLDLIRGIIARDAMFAAATAPTQPLARIDEVQLQLNWLGLREGHNVVRALHIANATISVPTPPDEVGPEQFTASAAYATFVFEDDGTIHIDQLNGLYCGIRVHVTGWLKPSTTTAAEPKTPAGDKSQFAFVTKALRELNSLRINEPPQIDVDFAVDLNQPLNAKVKARLRGADFGYRHVDIRTAAVDVGMRDGAIDITQCLIKIGTGELTLGGRYDIGMGQFDLKLVSTLDPSQLAGAMPEAVARGLRDVHVQDSPKLTARYVLSAETGTLPLLRGTLQTGAFTVRGVEFRSVSFAFEGKGPEMKISDARVVTPEGQVTGRGQFHIETSDFSYDFDSTINPRKLLPIMFPVAKQIVEPSQFETPPHIVASVRGDFVDPDAFAYNAEITADRCSYRGVPLEGASAKLQLRRGRLDVQGLVLKRTEGQLTGTLLADFNNHQINFNIHTTANPSEMAPLLGPKAAALMHTYRFGPGTAATAQGMADLEVPANSAWTAHVLNEGFGFWKLTAARARGELTQTNNVLNIDWFESEFYDGKLFGRGSVLLTNDVSYRFDFDLERCDVQKLIGGMRGKDSKVTGFMNARTKLTGQGSDLATLRGTGTLEVSDGLLWQAPLFGIFSQMLGNTKATSAKASFTVADQAVQTDDLEISAGAFTGKCRGKIDFDCKLDFRVEARFLSAIPGWNIISSLLGKLLEYKVSGTCDDPSYRAVNLPKELLPHD